MAGEKRNRPERHADARHAAQACRRRSQLAAALRSLRRTALPFRAGHLKCEAREARQPRRSAAKRNESLEAAAGFALACVVQEEQVQGSGNFTRAQEVLGRKPRRKAAGSQAAEINGSTGASGPVLDRTNWRSHDLTSRNQNEQNDAFQDHGSPMSRSVSVPNFLQRGAELPQPLAPRSETRS